MAQDTADADSPSAGAGPKARSRLHPTALLIALAIAALYVLSLVLQANSGITRNATEYVDPGEGNALVYLQFTGIDTEGGSLLSMCPRSRIPMLMRPDRSIGH